MKKLLLLLSCLLSLSAYATENDPVFVNLGTSVTNIAASTTNTTAGPIFTLPLSPSQVRFYVTAQGNAATTNAGAATVSNLVVFISTACGNEVTTNNFDTAQLSNIKITVPNLGSATNTASDWMVMSGVKYLRVGAIQNNNLGSVSNLQVILSYPK
jgi:hypothetical protein